MKDILSELLQTFEKLHRAKCIESYRLKKHVELCHELLHYALDPKEMEKLMFEYEVREKIMKTQYENGGLGEVTNFPDIDRLREWIHDEEKTTENYLL